jgi:DNA-binding Xre family transcriptional regulator
VTAIARRVGWITREGGRVQFRAEEGLMGGRTFTVHDVDRRSGRQRCLEVGAPEGWTQAELAKEAAVSRATVNRIENGSQISIRLDVLGRIADALGVPPGLLLRS